MSHANSVRRGLLPQIRPKPISKGQKISYKPRIFRSQHSFLGVNRPDYKTGFGAETRRSRDLSYGSKRGNNRSEICTHDKVQSRSWLLFKQSSVQAVLFQSPALILVDNQPLGDSSTVIRLSSHDKHVTAKKTIGQKRADALLLFIATMKAKRNNHLGCSLSLALPLSVRD